jgi:hypothetical protein
LCLEEIVELLLLNSDHLLLNDQDTHSLLLVELVYDHSEVDQNHAVHPEKNFACTHVIRVDLHLKCNLLKHGKVRAHYKHRTVKKHQPFNIVEEHTIHKDESNKILPTKELEIVHINCDSRWHDVSLG